MPILPLLPRYSAPRGTSWTPNNTVRRSHHQKGCWTLLPMFIVLHCFTGGQNRLYVTHIVLQTNNFSWANDIKLVMVYFPLLWFPNSGPVTGNPSRFIKFCLLFPWKCINIRFVAVKITPVSLYRSPEPIYSFWLSASRRPHLTSRLHASPAVQINFAGWRSLSVFWLLCKCCLPLCSSRVLTPLKHDSQYVENLLAWDLRLPQHCFWGLWKNGTFKSFSRLYFYLLCWANTVLSLEKKKTLLLK